MLQRIMAAHTADPSVALSTLLSTEMQSKFIGQIPVENVKRLVADVYPLVPENVETEFSLKTLEKHAERCGLDLTVKGIKSRNPPGDKSWKDAQRQLYDETLAASLFLKVYYLKGYMRYPDDDAFLADYPELDKFTWIDSPQYLSADLKRRREMEKAFHFKVLACTPRHLLPIVPPSCGALKVPPVPPPPPCVCARTWVRSVCCAT
jgi:hypothetical protein